MIKYKFLKDGFVTGVRANGSVLKDAKKTAFKAGDVIENVTFTKGFQGTTGGAATTQDRISWVQNGYAYWTNVKDANGVAVVEEVEKETTDDKDVVAQTTDEAKTLFADYRVQIGAVVVVTGLLLWMILKTKPVVKVA